MTFKNTLDNKKYHTLNYYYQNKYHTKVCKISLNTGLSCPNKDGSISHKGCIFCSKGSGEFGGNPKDDLLTQFNKIKKLENKKWPKAKYIAYFQANTNTYADVNTLKKLYEPFTKLKDVVGINIATRSDAISDEVFEYLLDLNKRTDLVIELGLQSMYDKTLKLINRGHDLKSFENMVIKLKQNNIKVVVHIINGLPYETKEMMINTAKYLNKLHIDGIKIHMLCIIKNTVLEDIFKSKPFHVLTKEEYINITCSQLEYLNPNIVINRICSDPNPCELIEPIWVIKKFCVLNDIDKYMNINNITQGDLTKE